MDQESNLLVLEGITKIFARGTVDEVTALNDIHLGVRAQDYVTVIGSNGAGKTTMLNIIAGVYPPEKGRVIIRGIDITRLKECKHSALVGRVYQDPNIG